MNGQTIAASPYSAQRFLAHARRHLHGSAGEATISSAELATPGDDDLNPGDASWLDPGQTFREAAVLVPLVQKRGELHAIFTQRTDALPSHPGQISFPGGKIDADDDGALAAALRETEEETGIDRRFVDVIGYLDRYRTGTGYRITPVVALVREGFTLVPEPGEVAEIFDVPLSFLMDDANHRTESRVWRGKRRYYYAMPYQHRYIWGATAGIVRNMFERLYKLPPADNRS